VLNGRLHEIKNFGNPQGRAVSKIKDFDGSAKDVRERGGFVKALL